MAMSPGACLAEFFLETTTMRTLKRHCPAQALPPLATFRKQTKEARVFRRAQAVRAIVAGHRRPTVSDSLHLP